MKILHVITDVHKQGGGTSEAVPRLCRAMKDSGEDVVLAGLDAGEISDTAHDAIAAGVKYRGESLPDWYLPRALGCSSQFKKLLPELVHDADIVHIHGLWQLAGWMAAQEAIKQHKPYLVMPHGFLEPARLKISRWKKRIMGAFFDNPMLKHAVAIVATSESEASGIRKYGLTNPIYIMPIGLDVEKYTLSKCYGKILLYFSRITPIKGLDMLAEVWGHMNRKGWRLLIVGPDDRGYAEEMKALFAAKCSADSYEFRPPVFGDEKYKLLSAVDAFVLPTRSENWSIAVAEAMASGLPVVCTKGAPWECLNTVHAGWWVDINEAAIQKGLEQLIAIEGAERQDMGRRGRRWVLENLAWNKVAGDMVQFYGECCSQLEK